MKKVWQVFWRISISLKFAVAVILGLTAALIVATVLESKYDTPTAQYWVYQTIAFYGLLGLLGWLILAVALSRLPWQKRHLPFLCAHLGILLLLYGSWLTFQFGIDGSMTVGEGKTESALELTDPLLVISDEGKVNTVPVPWIPPNADFKPIEVPTYGLRVAEFISRAESKVDFVPATGSLDLSAPAIRLKIAGGPSAPPFMRMGQETWIWGGDANWMRQQVGPAILAMAPSADPLAFSSKGPELSFRLDTKKSALLVSIQTADGKKTDLVFPFKEPKDLVGTVIKTGWKFDATATILEWIPKAMTDVKFAPARIQYGASAPSSAILLQTSETKASPASKIWLGLGDRATLDIPGADGKTKRVTLAYFPRRLVLPFGVKLEQFKIDRYQGTMNPSEFSSIVSVDGAATGEKVVNHPISMNEPLKYGGYTFYQASYIDAQPRPTTSVFSVNQDPGRWLKYWGSILLVLGSAWLFAMKYWKKKREVSIGNPLLKGNES